MKTSNKILAVFLCYLLAIALISWLVVAPFFAAQQEPRNRAAAAGSVECAVFGSSHGMMSLNPQTMEEGMGWVTYNYCNLLMKDAAKQFIAEKEFSRNPIHTVILDLTFNSLFREQATENGEGDYAVVRNLDTFPERVRFLAEHVPLDTWLDVYGRELVGSVRYWQTVFTGRVYDDGYLPSSNRGFCASVPQDVSLADDQVAAIRGTRVECTPFQPSAVDALKELIAYCQSQGARVILLTVPISDALIWELADLGEFEAKAREIAGEMHCEWYDLNLLKNKSELFSDATCFHDVAHLSEEGSKIYMQELVNLLTRVDRGEDVSDLFFSSYEEATRATPYYSKLT